MVPLWVAEQQSVGVAVRECELLLLPDVSFAKTHP